MKTSLASILILITILYFAANQPECNYDSVYVSVNNITCNCFDANYSNFDQHYRFIGGEPTIKDIISDNYMYGNK